MFSPVGICCVIGKFRLQTGLGQYFFDLWHFAVILIGKKNYDKKMTRPLSSLKILFAIFLLETEIMRELPTIFFFDEIA